VRDLLAAFRVQRFTLPDAPGDDLQVAANPVRIDALTPLGEVTPFGKKSKPAAGTSDPSTGPSNPAKNRFNGLKKLRLTDSPSGGTATSPGAGG
jgi:hypothetical protein